MPDLAPTMDGLVSNANQSSWANARDATSGTGFSTATSRTPFAVRASRTIARGGGYAYSVTRSFFEFDTSGISVTPSDATLKIYGYVFNSAAKLFIVKANFSDGALANGDFDAMVGWSNSGVNNLSNVTQYSAEITPWSTSGYNDITLNSTALADMRDDDLVKFCLIQSTMDLQNQSPTGELAAGVHFQEHTGTSSDPILNYTAGAAGYGNAVLGVASANIGGINGVATANIEKVIGV
jgi:hypothetical protein